MATETFELTPKTRSPYRPRLAQVGDLKTAFLAAFAAFGYRYAFDKRLEIVRRQILCPEEDIIHSWNITIDVELDSFALIWIQDQPAILVKVDGAVVVLPWLLGPVDFYPPAAAAWRSQKGDRLSAKLLIWPKTLEMALDFAAQEFTG